MKIRRVTVEFLRAGPRHNQLLSPLTQYLGVCGDAPAGIVTVPFEHREIEQRRSDLGYETDVARRQYTLEKTGREIGGMLSLVPSLPGVLNSESAQRDTVTHLRIVLSASELAMLPFELAKTPTGGEPSSEWLALQSRMPLCVTRHIRSVSTEAVRWPVNFRLLLVLGPDTGSAADEHKSVLAGALLRWYTPDDLVVLDDATAKDIEDQVERAAVEGKPFTHVHIVAHGAPLDDADPNSPVGVALQDQTVSGERLGLLLTGVGERAVVGPAVVTLATCDSGKVPDVRMAAASIAHDLHDRGIPLVVASQFPLSYRGSRPFVERFYRGQLTAEHPLVSLYHLRLMLHRRFGNETHDWASIVVYEALPTDFEEQLHDVRYWQTRRLHDRSLRGVESLVGNSPSREQYDALVRNAEEAAAALPTDGNYLLECTGLRAAGEKRIGQAALNVALTLDAANEWRALLVDEFRKRLERSRWEYHRAARMLAAIAELDAFPGLVVIGRKKANLHWMLGQLLSLDAVLGRPLDLAAWTTARHAAEKDAHKEDEVERAWAFVSLCEQALLRLDEATLSAGERSRHASEALEHAARIVDIVGRGAEHVMTTSRQFERYATVWGNPQLRELGLDPHPHWNVENGLVPTALSIVRVLRGDRGPPPRASGAGEQRNDAPRDAPAQPASPADGEEAASLARRSPRRGAKLFTVEMLPALNGDCLWIEYGDARDPNVILVDCGATSTAEAIAGRIAARERPLDLFVLTHIDADHIDGVLPMFEHRTLDGKVGDVWFNGWKQLEGFLSVEQGEVFSTMLGDPQRRLPWNRAFTDAGATVPAPVFVRDDGPLPAIELPGGMRLTLLSPGPDDMRALALHWKRVLDELRQREAMLGRRKRPPPVTDPARFELEPLAATPVRKDPSVANGSSIAFLAEFEGRSLMLTGDAHAGVLEKSLARLARARGHDGAKLAIDAVKLSHHGSMHGTTRPLLDRIDCPRYLVSTNGRIFCHPDREAIARVVLHGGEKPTLCFNYRSEFNGLWGERELRTRYRYEALYPEDGSAGLRMTL